MGTVPLLTRYGLDGPVIEFAGGGRRPWGSTQPPVHWVPDLSPPNLAPRLKKEYSHTSTPPLGLRGLFYSELYLTCASFFWG